MRKVRLCGTGPGWMQYRIVSGETEMTYREVALAWQCDSTFQTQFNEWIARSPFEALFFEVRPVQLTDLDDAFEFVLAEAVALAGITATPNVFRDHYAQEGVVCFPNLGADAELVVPCPRERTTDYTHLAAFARTGSTKQTQLFWQLAGERIGELLGAAPLWLSTSGLGVAWLHLRLDQYPKYYTHLPYRSL